VLRVTTAKNMMLWSQAAHPRIIHLVPILELKKYSKMKQPLREKIFFLEELSLGLVKMPASGQQEHLTSQHH